MLATSPDSFFFLRGRVGGAFSHEKRCSFLSSSARVGVSGAPVAEVELGVVVECSSAVPALAESRSSQRVAFRFGEEGGSPSYGV